MNGQRSIIYVHKMQMRFLPSSTPDLCKQHLLTIDCVVYWSAACPLLIPFDHVSRTETFEIKNKYFQCHESADCKKTNRFGNKGTKNRTFANVKSQNAFCNIACQSMTKKFGFHMETHGKLIFDLFQILLRLRLGSCGVRKSKSVAPSKTTFSFLN